MNKRNRGFTLIELMIVVAIIAIIVTWGYSSYRDTVLKARRAEGMGELLTIADNLERYYADHGTYSTADLTKIHSTSSENGYYVFSITQATTVQFTVTATPQGGQADDSKCGTYTLSSDGNKQASGSKGSVCW